MRAPPAPVVPLGLIRSKGVVLGAAPILGRLNPVVWVELRARDRGVRFRVKIHVLRLNLLHGFLVELVRLQLWRVRLQLLLVRLDLVRLNGGQFAGLNRRYGADVLL